MARRNIVKVSWTRNGALAMASFAKETAKEMNGNVLFPTPPCGNKAKLTRLPTW